MSGDVYKPLPSIVGEDDQTLGLILENQPVNERRILLGNLISKLMGHSDNEELMLRIFEWMKHAIWDEEVQQFLTPHPNNEKLRILTWDSSVHRSRETKEDKIAELCANEALKLYVQLPKFRDGKMPHAQSELLKVREALLSEMTSRCFNTADDFESDKLFLSLLSFSMGYWDEEKILVEVIQKATSESVGLPRLERHFAKAMEEVSLGRNILPSRPSREGIAGAIAKGWMRKLISQDWEAMAPEKENRTNRRRKGLEHLLHGIEIMNPLRRSSLGSVLLVSRVSKEVALVDCRMDDLIRALRRDTPNKWPVERVRGDITIRYDEKTFNLQKPSVTITLPKSNSANDKQDVFALARIRIQAWKKEEEENKRFKILLTVTDDGADFKRSDEI